MFVGQILQCVQTFLIADYTKDEPEKELKETVKS